VVLQRRVSGRSPTPLSQPLGPPHERFAFQPIRKASHRGRKSKASFDSTLAIQAEYQWFNSLPEKVRRQHFSEAEREALSLGFEALTATAVAANRKRNSRSGTNRNTPSPYKSPSPRYSWNNQIESEEEMDQQQPQYQQNGLLSRSGSARRKLTISRQSNQETQGNRGRSPTSPQQNYAPKSPILSSHRRDWSHAGTIISFTRPSTDSARLAIDPDAVYYRNPEARSKLRQYLASPQKFDEALNYGFPSSPNTDEDRGPSPLPVPSSNNDAKAFLRHDSISFIDRYDEDEIASTYETSEEEMESPSTPGDPEWSWRTSKYNRLSIFGGLNSESLPSLDLKFQPEPPSPQLLSPQSLVNREMTLRMTLTRPDLRANDEDLYGWRKNLPEDDPLALEELPPIIEDHTGAQGAFATTDKRRSSSMFSKIFRKILQ
jgi:hypothetical protein